MKHKQRTIAPIHITKEGLEKVKREYADLLEQRKVLVDKVAVARAYGDLSENAAYHEARKNLFDADRQLRHLKMQIVYAEVDEAAEAGTVGLGSSVTVRSSAGKQTFTIVGIYEADPTQQKISDQSPIGRSLLGHKVGQTVRVTIPSGVLEYTIENIS